MLFWKRDGKLAVLAFARPFYDVLLDLRSNDIMSDFIRTKIRGIVKDPVTAEMLVPHDHPFGAKRPPIDTEYFETYNRDNVSLVDIRHNPVKRSRAHRCLFGR